MNNFIFGLVIGLMPLIGYGMVLSMRKDEENREPHLMRQRGRKLIAKGTKLCADASKIESRLNDR